jgi:flagellar basal body-associated protein FliL
MTDIDQDALDLDEPRGHSSLLKWALIGLIALLLLGGSGFAAWYFLLASHAAAHPKEVEAPLPYFMDLKPFVVSLPNKSGTPHFVQLGISLQLPREAAGEMVKAVLPEFQDAMRQTLLGYRTEDLQTPGGVDTVRKAMTEHLNQTATRVLGAERIAKLTAGAPNAVFVQNVLFGTLIVE